MWKKFTVNTGAVDKTVSEVLSYIQETLAAFRMNRKEENRANLMAEEALICLTEHGDFSEYSAVYVSIRKFFGNITIRLRVPGKSSALRSFFTPIFRLRILKSCLTLQRQFRI